MFHNPQRQQQNLQKQHIQQVFLHKHNTCQVQPKFNHELFQSNKRPWNSKECNFKKKIKTFSIGNLNKKTFRRRLIRGFWFLEAQHTLKTTVVWKLYSLNWVYLEVLGFITAPDHICTGLIEPKWNRFWILLPYYLATLR